MGIFSGLEKFGISNIDSLEDVEIIEKKNTAKTTKKEESAPVVVKKEVDFIIPRHYKCPCCDMDFMTKSVKGSGVKAIGKDTDLRPIYDLFDPLKYDAVSCDRCGYSAIARYFKNCTAKQAKMIQETLGHSFSGLDNNVETYTYDDAIERHKLALACTVVKRAKNSERAYTCLKLAWVLRGKRNTLDIKNPEEKEMIKQLYLDEKECINNAYEGFMIAMSSENYPIAGMDEITLKYVMSDFARRLKKYDIALKFIGDIITSKTAANRIKDEALKQKELIKNEMKTTQAQ